MALPFLQVRTRLMAFDENDIPCYTKFIDVTISETHTKKAKVARHPIGKGIPVADNVRPEAQEFTCVAFFSDHPATIDEIIKKVAGGLESVSETYDQLAEIVDLGWKFEVKTSFRTYDNMVLESISVPRASDKSNCIEATLKFVELRKAKSVKVGLPAKTPLKKKAAPKKPKATQTTKEVPKTGLKKIKDGLSSALTKVRAR